MFGIQLSDWGTIATMMSAITSLVLAILTLKYVNITKRTLNEMEITREESSRPYVIVDYEVDEKRFVHLYIENLGTTAAKKITIEMDSDVVLKNGKKAKDLIFDREIKYLVPNQRISTVLFPTWEIPEINGEYAERKVLIKYYNSDSKKKYTDEYFISLKPYKHNLYFKKVTTEDIVKSLNDINKSLKQISTTLNEEKES